MTIKTIITHFIFILFFAQSNPCDLLRRQKIKDRLEELNNSTTMNPATILYSRGDILLRGINNIPSSLIVTPGFTPLELPNEFRDNLIHLRSILFNHGYGTGRVFTSGEYPIPQWLSQQTNLKLLELRFFKLIDLKILRELPLEYLLLSNISLLDKEKVLKDISNMKHLKYLIQDDVFTRNEISYLKKANSTLEYLTIREYTRRIITKQIAFDKL